jgi:hypothetical protein
MDQFYGDVVTVRGRQMRPLPLIVARQSIYWKPKCLVVNEGLSVKCINKLGRYLDELA